ncbi:protein SCO1/2 [Salirhabdus euzebyi]|uniref:Protein SCO1/2 n=1 Tax=Salirhabdus euzebyi TaxID=394506 RepID=A0A841Q6P8_9BACI|nr:SCO family protein [Salirhabdus euzebyi]MBB6454055.1 protein SCO1/2 [Salirhabdus euzebyi]
MSGKTRNRLSVLIVFIFGFFLFYIGTDGFKAYTAESARTYELMKSKPDFPSVTLEDSKKRTYTLQEFAEGKYVFITFMYTNCGTVCPQLEMNMAKVYDKIPSPHIGKDILFLSISFDPTNDGPETLEKYRSYFGSDGETWRMARVENELELQQLLDRFGVVVIPDGYGNFQHNSAFYLVDRNGKLVEVMDYTQINEATDTVMTYVNYEKEG